MPSASTGTDKHESKKMCWESEVKECHLFCKHSASVLLWQKPKLKRF